MSDDEFLAAFDETTLPAAAWTHAAHVRMAYLKLTRLPDGEALAAIRSGIQRYNAAQGNHTGYNECVTVAFVRIVAGRLRARPAPTFEDFTLQNPDLFAEGVRILLRYYSYPVWKSPESRARFLEPDREPLP